MGDRDAYRLQRDCTSDALVTSQRFHSLVSSSLLNCSVSTLRTNLLWREKEVITAHLEKEAIFCCGPSSGSFLAVFGFQCHRGIQLSYSTQNFSLNFDKNSEFLKYLHKQKTVPDATSSQVYEIKLKIYSFQNSPVCRTKLICSNHKNFDFINSQTT